MQQITFDPGAIVPWLAGVLVALETLRRGVVKPMRRLYVSVTDLIDRWHQIIEDVNGLKDVFLDHIQKTDKAITAVGNRVARIEESEDMKHLIDDETYRQTNTQLARQIAASLRSRRDDDLPKE